VKKNEEEGRRGTQKKLKEEEEKKYGFNLFRYRFNVCFFCYSINLTFLFVLKHECIHFTQLYQQQQQQQQQ